MGSKPTKTKPSQKKPGVTLRTPLQLVIPQTNTLRKQNTFFPPSNPINEEIPAKKQIYKPPPPPKEINYNIQQQEENILDSKSISSYHFDKELEIKQKPKNKEPLGLQYWDPNTTADPEIKFRKFMLRKTKYDMHLSIFKRNPDLMYFIIFILSSEGNKKLIPFRNKNCRNGNCIYDLDELVKKYKDSHFSNYMNFICHHCKELIDINNFFLDMTLKKIIDDVFVKYNKIKLQCKEITIFRNGLWEPNLPEYLKLLEKNIDSNSKKNNDNKIANLDEIPILRTAKNKFKSPNFSEYNRNDEKLWDEKLIKLKLKPDKTILRYDRLKLSYKDYFQLKSDNFSLSLMSYFINIMMGIQNAQSQLYNLMNGNTIYLLGINILNLDKYYKKAKYEYIKGTPPNVFKKKPDYLKEIYNLLGYIVLVEGRWILYLIDLNNWDYYIIDFIEESLSTVTIDHLSDLAFYLTKKEFGVKLKEFNIYDVQKIDYLSDCGVYITYFLYKFLSNPQLLNIAINFNEKNHFKNQLCWSILKICPLINKPILFYEFEKTPEEKEAERQYQLAKKRKEVRKQQELLQNNNKNIKNSLQKIDYNGDIIQNQDQNDEYDNKSHESYDIHNPEPLTAYLNDEEGILNNKKISMNPRITKKLSQPIINEDPNETDTLTNEKKGIRIKSKASIIPDINVFTPNALNNKKSMLTEKKSIPESLPRKSTYNTKAPELSSRKSTYIKNEPELLSRKSTYIKNEPELLSRKSTYIKNEPDLNEPISPKKSLTTRKTLLSGTSFLNNDEKNKIIQGIMSPTRLNQSFRSKSGIFDNDGEILNLTKEEFQEILNKFKEKLREKIKENEIKEEIQMENEEIEIKDDMIFMNKYHLKKLMEEYEEYLREKYEEENENDYDSEYDDYDNYYNPYGEYEQDILNMSPKDVRRLFGKNESSDSEEERKSKKKGRKKK